MCDYLVLSGVVGLVGVGVVGEAACVATDRRAFATSYDAAHTTLLANYVGHAVQVCLVVDDTRNLHKAVAGRMDLADVQARVATIEHTVADAIAHHIDSRRAKVAPAFVVRAR